MKFTSVREYFYKLQSILYLFVLAPLILFGFVYLEIQEGSIVPPMILGEGVLVEVVVILTLTDWWVALVSFRRRLRVLPTKIKLSEKLEGYATATYLRFSLISGGSVLLGGGFYLTGSNLFAALFAVNIMLMSLFWPLPQKVCNDLNLKGEERNMVLRRNEPTQ